MATKKTGNKWNVFIVSLSTTAVKRNRPQKTSMGQEFKFPVFLAEEARNLNVFLPELLGIYKNMSKLTTQQGFSNQ